jgi:hypothetical protein
VSRDHGWSDRDLGITLAYGEEALAGDRKSVPSLATVAASLGQTLESHYANANEAQAFVAHLRESRGSQ